jgi:hypothetical protein
VEETTGTQDEELRVDSLWLLTPVARVCGGFCPHVVLIMVLELIGHCASGSEVKVWMNPGVGPVTVDTDSHPGFGGFC